MSDVQVQLVLDSHKGPYRPGEELAGEYRITCDEPRQVRAIEVSVLWYTLGKGDEDLGVHFFERETGEEGATLVVAPLEGLRPRRFATVLPESPLSYDGVIVKVCWCARVRVFLPRGREVVTETPFKLGSIVPAELIEA